MSNIINEFNSVLSIMSVPPVGAAIGADAAEIPFSPTVAQDSPQEALPAQPSRTVSLTPVDFSFSSTCEDGSSVFNLTFDVMVYENNSMRTYKVVKTICVSPDKLADEAARSQPIQVIEKLSDSDMLIKRFSVLGGV